LVELKPADSFGRQIQTMTPASCFVLIAVVFSSSLGIAVLVRQRPSVAGCCFSGGMILLAAEALLDGLSACAVNADAMTQWHMLSAVVASLLPVIWVCFSLTYSRGNYREFLFRWRFGLIALLLVPVGFSLGFRNEMFNLVPPSDIHPRWWLSFTRFGNALNVVLLIANILILVGIENTFRAAAGTMRWRIKFVVLGLAIIFGARLYTRSQALLFSGQDIAITSPDTAALLIGCALISVAYLRTGFIEIDVYPSQAVLQSSITIVLAGAYLFIVGVMAQIIALFGKAVGFRFHAFVVLLAIALLGVLLLSDRVRQGTQRFVSRHFKRPQHDFRKVWTAFTQRTSHLRDKVKLSEAAGKLVSETFNVLGVTIWLFDEQRQQLVFGASTSQCAGTASKIISGSEDCSLMRIALHQHAAPFDLEKTKEQWVQPLKGLTSAEFRRGGNRFCVPLFVGERWLGVVILADRVNGVPYTMEERELLKCLADQLAASLLNLTLTEELMVGKELEAFQTMAAFFVHDLKNAASSLTLMLRNLPVHFDDPAFREDALRGIGNAVTRIQQMIERLCVLRNSLQFKPVEIDLHELIQETLANLEGSPDVNVIEESGHYPKVVADREQIRSVLINLLMNAGEAGGPGARVSITTTRQNGHVVLSVSDNGCGMSPDFLKHSLFRPFQTTKKRGLGIGMFQSKMIVEAHHGRIEVESEQGRGTTFHVRLPSDEKTRLSPLRTPAPDRP
jgi:putative PEP-CTERM system histidine kinase